MQKHSNVIPVNAHAIIIGSMKCGTSSMFNYLSAHPKICGSISKEPEYFSQTQSHKLSYQAYEECWDFDPEQHEIALEASVGYTKYPMEWDVPKRMHESGILPRFIYMVRDPIKRIVSHYEFMRATNRNWKLEVTDDHLVNVSRYYLQLSRFREFFSAERFKVIDLNELSINPRSTLDETYRFLGLEEGYYPPIFSTDNPRKNSPELLRKLVRSPLYPIAKLVPTRVRRSVERLTLNVLGESPPYSLSEENETWLRDELRGDMELFASEYSFDISKWGF